MKVTVEEEMKRGRQLTLKRSRNERLEVAGKQKQIVEVGKREREAIGIPWCRHSEWFTHHCWRFEWQALASTQPASSKPTGEASTVNTVNLTGNRKLQIVFFFFSRHMVLHAFFCLFFAELRENNHVCSTFDTFTWYSHLV